MWNLFSLYSIMNRFSNLKNSDNKCTYVLVLAWKSSNAYGTAPQMQHLPKSYLFLDCLLKMSELCFYHADIITGQKPHFVPTKPYLRNCDKKKYSPPIMLILGSRESYPRPTPPLHMGMEGKK